jgi:hypothetical protein
MTDPRITETNDFRLWTQELDVDCRLAWFAFELALTQQKQED